MTIASIVKLISLNALLCFILFSSYGDHGHKIRSSNDNDLNTVAKSNSLLEHPRESDTNNSPYYRDTVIAKTSRELIEQINSNRLIKLVSNEYHLASTLVIDHIKDLKIAGTASSKLMIEERNATVAKILHAHNIHLDSLEMGHKESSGHKGEHGVLSISDSQNINISNCKLFGAGTFGLITNDVYNLKFSNSEITECTFLIFELSESRKIEFSHSKFHNNNLAISVLGAFTNSTKEVVFSKCGFLNNKPDMVGNPAFNFMDNYGDFDHPIIFIDCTFKNNKGFKWYGDKIELNNCQIDSSDFIGFH